MLSLLPSAGSVMFCSDKCLQAAETTFKDELDCLAESNKNCWPDRSVRVIKESLAIAGDVEELRKLVDGSKKETIFSFKLNKSFEADKKVNLLKCILGLMEKQFPTVFDFTEMYQRVVQEALTDDEKFLEMFVLKQTLASQYNTISFKQHDRFTFKTIEDAAGIFPFSSLINHSCLNNVHPIAVDNKLAWVVVRPIMKESQIFTNYGTNLYQSVDVKKKYLKDEFGISCECKICDERISAYTLKNHCDKVFKEPPTGFTSVQEAKLEIANNWNYINTRKPKYHPSYEVDRLTTRNIVLLDCISGKLFSPV